LIGRLVLFAFLALVLTMGAGMALPIEGAVAGAATLAFGGIVAGWVLLRHDGWPSGSLGLVPDHRAALESFAGLGVGVGVAAVSMALMAIGGALRWTPDAAIWSLTSWGAEGARSLAWLAVPAAAEEVLLRGYALAATARVLGPGVALWVTSGVFGLLHALNPGVGPLALVGVTAAGLLLGGLVLRTGSLWPAIGAHLGWNWALAFLGDVSVSGLEVADAPGYDGVAQGAAWLSGGSFGVEASVIAVLMLSLAAVLVWRTSSEVPEGRPSPIWIRMGTQRPTGA
jgi:membrane protease YdiL (CAAX protease family)